MKIYNTQAEFDADIIDGVFKIKGDVIFRFDVKTTASIKARDIDSWDIKARNIDSRNIDALNINAKSVKLTPKQS